MEHSSKSHSPRGNSRLIPQAHEEASFAQSMSDRKMIVGGCGKRVAAGRGLASKLCDEQILGLAACGSLDVSPIGWHEYWPELPFDLKPDLLGIRGTVAYAASWRSLARQTLIFGNLRPILGVKIDTMSVTLHTGLGDIKIEVFCESVPRTAENFLALCASGAYDNSPVHRLLPSFMFQTGSPASASTKVSTSIWQEPFEDEIRPTLRHNARGIVSMANKGPATNGSQFFICFAAAPHLDGKNTVFGKVIGGDDVLAKIERLPVDGKNRPKEGVAINSVTMHANPMAG